MGSGVANGDSRLVLGPDLRIAQARALQQQMLTAMEADGAVELHASAVERIDACGLQLLVALVGTATSRGRSVEWYEPSEALVDAARRCGLASVLELSQ